MKRSLSVTYAPREKILGRDRIWSGTNRRVFAWSTVSFSWNYMEMPEKVQAELLVLWVADEHGCVCCEHALPGGGMQEKTEGLEVRNLLEIEMPIDSMVEDEPKAYGHVRVPGSGHHDAS